MKKHWLVQLLRKVHRDEQGTVSLETVLILGAVAMVVLAFLIKYAWPKVKDIFWKGMKELEQEGAGGAAPPS